MNKLQILELAVKVLNPVPEGRVNLSTFTTWLCNTDPSMSIHCLGGHLAVSKEFNELGLYLNARGFPMHEEGECDVALEAVFQDDSAFWKYFNMRSRGIWDPELLLENPDMSDKDLALARLRKGIEIESTLET